MKTQLVLLEQPIIVSDEEIKKGEYNFKHRPKIINNKIKILKSYNYV